MIKATDATIELFSLPRNPFAEIHLTCDDLLPPQQNRNHNNNNTNNSNNNNNSHSWPNDALYEKYFSWFMNDTEKFTKFDDYRNRMGRCYKRLYDELIFDPIFKQFGAAYDRYLSILSNTPGYPLSDCAREYISKYAQAKVLYIVYIFFGG